MASNNKVGYEVYSVNEVCRMLGVNRMQLFKIIAQHNFQTIHVGKHVKISKKSFDAWMMEYKTIQECMLDGSEEYLRKTVKVAPSYDRDEVFEFIPKMSFDMDY